MTKRTLAKLPRMLLFSGFKACQDTMHRVEQRGVLVSTSPVRFDLCMPSTKVCAEFVAHFQPSNEDHELVSLKRPPHRSSAPATPVTKSGRP